MTEAIIFDMDGVLIDSEPIHYKADTELFRKMGIEVPDPDRDLFVGMGAEGVYSYLRDKFNLPQSISELLEFDQNFRLSFFRSHKLSAMPGIPEFLAAIKQSGIPMGLASSSVRLHVDYILSTLGLDHFFKVIVTGDEVERTKPDPELFLKASTLLGINPSACLVIEDSDNGIRAAHLAGMKCVAYRTNPDSVISAIKADWVISSFVDLTPAKLMDV
jgi:HAD superfamily hydrolase (TIGR01509 family)